MKAYKKVNSDSGVSFYEVLEDGIIIRFNDGSTYLYTFRSAGKTAISRMKQLAASGKGLTTYINQHVKKKYEKQLR
jgi:hypothetical protein